MGDRSGFWLAAFLAACTAAFFAVLYPDAFPGAALHVRETAVRVAYAWVALGEWILEIVGRA